MAHINQNVEELASITPHDNSTPQNIIEVSNIYPTTLVKRNIQASRRSDIAIIRSKADLICREEIPATYIHYAFNRFKHGFVYYVNNIPIAFCIWKVKTHIRWTINTYKELYIYLICGKQLDYKLVPRIIDDVVYLCRKTNVQYITLEPANRTLKSYYIKCNFEEKQDIGGTELLVLDVWKARISTPISTIYRTTQKYKKRARLRAIKHIIV